MKLILREKTLPAREMRKKMAMLTIYQFLAKGDALLWQILAMMNPKKLLLQRHQMTIQDRYQQVARDWLFSTVIRIEIAFLFVPFLIASRPLIQRVLKF